MLGGETDPSQPVEQIGPLLGVVDHAQADHRADPVETNSLANLRR
jgi:hypothetical protein